MHTVDIAGAIADAVGDVTSQEVSLVGFRVFAEVEGGVLEHQSCGGRIGKCCAHECGGRRWGNAEHQRCCGREKRSKAKGVSKAGRDEDRLEVEGVEFAD